MLIADRVDLILYDAHRGLHYLHQNGITGIYLHPTPWPDGTCTSICTADIRRSFRSSNKPYEI